jgi:AraC-like DNA-binding protein
LYSPEAPLESSPQYERWAAANSSSHKVREICIALKGKYFYRFQGHDYACRPGTVFFINRMEEHANGYPINNPELAHLWLINAGGNLMATLHKFKDGVHESKNISVLPETHESVRILNRYWDELSAGKHDWEPPEAKREKLVSALSCALIAVVEKGAEKKESNSVEKSQKQVVDAIKKHIMESGGYMESLERLARIAGYSKFHFLRMFKTHSGETVHSFINKCRLEKVDEMLNEGRSKKEISYELGFSCPAAFHNWHKKYI